jgi:dTDP-4-dehydrorhamnose reductase
MRVLVLGASGMLGNAMLRVMSERNDWDIYGALRSANSALQSMAPRAQFIHGIDANKPDSLVATFTQSRPQIVINCVGLVKQLANVEDPLEAIPINGLLPHRLARLCELVQARLVHISTDCVFSGRKGNYLEADVPDAEDVYGRSKLLGEVNYPHTVTLRTSIIGHELGRSHSLIGWFLAQQGCVTGYTEAIFSGLPTCELARVVRDVVIPNRDLHGLYHVAAEPISKHDLLQIVNREYGKALHIEPDNKVKINRSLDASRFKEATGYVAPPWPELVAKMNEFR